jgi:hypothetical protein
MFKDYTDTQLVAAYHATRKALWEASQARRATGVIRLDRDLDIIVAIARKRGVALNA